MADTGLHKRIWNAARTSSTRAGALAQLRHASGEALPDVVPLLTVKDEGIQSSLRYLFAKHPSEAASALVVVAKQASPATSGLAVTALAGIDSEIAQDALFNLGLKSARPVRLRALEAVGERRIRRGVVVLTLASRDPDWEIRLTAVRALGNLGVASCWRHVGRLLDDQHVLVRRAALEALDQLAAPLAVPLLAEFVGNYDSISRDRAHKAIQHTIMEHPESLAVLLGRDDEDERLLAIELIIQVGVDIGLLAEFAGCDADSDELVDCVRGWLRDAEWPDVLDCLAQVDADQYWVFRLADALVEELDGTQLQELADVLGDSPLIKERIRGELGAVDD